MGDAPARNLTAWRLLIRPVRLIKFARVDGVESSPLQVVTPPCAPLAQFTDYPCVVKYTNKKKAFIIRADDLAEICSLIHKLYDPETSIRRPGFGTGGTQGGGRALGGLAWLADRVAVGNFAAHGRLFVPGPMAYPDQCHRARMVFGIL